MRSSASVCLCLPVRFCTKSCIRFYRHFRAGTALSFPVNEPESCLIFRFFRTASAVRSGHALCGFCPTWSISPAAGISAALKKKRNISLCRIGDPLHGYQRSDVDALRTGPTSENEMPGVRSLLPSFMMFVSAEDICFILISDVIHPY